MRLKNKQTGEIGDITQTSNNAIIVYYPIVDGVAINPQHRAIYESLAELNMVWEDYEEPKEYYYLDYGGRIKAINDANDEEDMARKAIGNYFETKEEAENAVEKLKAAKRLKDKGFKIKGWKFTPDMKQIEGNYVKIEAEVPQILINEKDLDLLFGGVE